MAKGAMDIFLIYQFLKRLVTPFEKWKAYEVGLIDKNGKVIVPENERTMAQNKEWGFYDRLVANLKKLLGKIPGGKSRIASFAAALLLLKEENLDPDDLEYLEERLEFYMDEAEFICEENPTNVAGAGQVDGIGVGPNGEPAGITASEKKKKKKKFDPKLMNIVDRMGDK